MKTEKEDAAFARTINRAANKTALDQKGLTKREYFASLAMQGMVTNSRLFDNDFGQIAELSVSMADTLIEALNNHI